MTFSIEHSLAVRGLSVSQVAREHKVTRRWIYQLCKEKNLPRNNPIRPRSRTETEVCKALIALHLNTVSVGRAFSQAPCNIERVIASVRKQEGEGYKPSHAKKRAPQKRKPRSRKA